MIESIATRKALTDLRKDSQWVVLKYSDNFTVGLPDASVSKNSRTTFIEFKNIPFNQYRLNLSYIKVAPQLMAMRRLEWAAQAIYVIFNKTRPHLTLVISPELLFQHIRFNHILVAPEVLITDSWHAIWASKRIVCIDHQDTSFVLTQVLNYMHGA